MNGLTWLLRLDLPSGSAFMSDGGVTIWGGNTYTANHPVLGGIKQIGELTEGFGPELPEQELIIAPPSNAAVSPLQQGCWRRSAVRLWLAEFDEVTGAVVGTPDLRFAGRMDRMRQTFAFQQLGIVLTCVPETEVLLFSDDGNGLSAEFHKSLYAGETGHDQATGLVRTVTWGVESGRSGNGGNSSSAAASIGAQLFGGGFGGNRS